MKLFKRAISAALAAIFCLTLVTGIIPTLKIHANAEKDNLTKIKPVQNDEPVEASVAETEVPTKIELPAEKEEHSEKGKEKTTKAAAPLVEAKAATVIFHNELKKGTLKVKKTADDGFVEGLRFHLFGTSLTGDTVDMTVDTNADGIALFENVPISGVVPYTLEEVNTPGRYFIPVSQNAEIAWNEITNMTFENKLKPGKVKIIKTSEDNLVEGLKFHLFGTSITGEKVDMYAVTNSDGIAVFENVPVSGETPYTVEEVDTPNRYIVPEGQNVTVETGASEQTLNFHNELKKGTVKIIKTSEDNFVEGLRFRLFGTSIYGASVELFAVTDADGIALFENVPINGLEPYTVEEVDTPNRYVVPEGQDVTIEVGGTSELNFHNTLRRGSLKIIKTSEDGNVAGIDFNIIGNNVDVTVTSDENGEIIVPDLLPGEYVVTEIVPDIYLEQPAQNVTVIADETAVVTFNNILKRGGLQIIKTSENGIIAGISFIITGPNGYENTVTTDENGMIYIPGLLPGIYTITEIVPDGYIPQKPKTVEVKADEIVIADKNKNMNLSASSSEPTKISVQGYINCNNIISTLSYGKVGDEPAMAAFKNELKKGSLKVIKSADDNFVSGIKFHLFGESETGENVDMYAVTDDTGIAMFNDVPVSGETPYTVEETGTPERYIVPEGQDVTIIWNETSVVDFHNTLKHGGVKIIKTSDDGNVAGIDFNIIGNDVDVTVTSDENGEILVSDLVPGEYIVTEIVPEGYEPQEPKTITVKADEITEVEFHNVPVEVPETPETGDKSYVWVGITFIVSAASLFAVAGAVIYFNKRKELRK